LPEPFPRPGLAPPAPGNPTAPDHLSDLADDAEDDYDQVRRPGNEEGEHDREQEDHRLRSGLGQAASHIVRSGRKSAFIPSGRFAFTRVTASCAGAATQT